MLKHKPPCTGGHVEDFPCSEAVRIRAEWTADKWTCRFSTARGQPVHWFNDAGECQYEPCGAILSELEDELKGKEQSKEADS